MEEDKKGDNMESPINPTRETRKEVPKSKRSSQFRQYLAALIVNIGTFAYGTVIGWPANALPHLQSQDSPLSTGPISGEDASWLASILCIPATPATLLYAYLCQRYGCKIVGYLVAVPYIISWTLVIFADTVPILYISKLIVGLSSAGCYIVSSVYVRDTAEDNIRGSLCASIITSVNAGLVFGYTIGSFFSYQTVAIISLIIPCIFSIAFFFLPETPIYLLKQEKQAEAKESLQWLRGKEVDVEEELERIKTLLKSIKAEHSKSTSFMELFRPKRNLRAFMIGIILCFNQQLCGFFAIINYTVTIFKESGSNLPPNISSIIVGAMLLGGTYLSTLLVDRVGRKVLLLLSDVSMSVSLGILGLYFYFKEPGKDLSSVGWIPVTCMSIFVVFFAVGFFPVPYVLLTEIFSPRIREMASSIAMAETWILAFGIAKCFTLLGDTIGLHGCYWMFSVICALGTLYIIIEVPETKGRTLECIQEDLDGRRLSLSAKYMFSSNRGSV